jgi:hypothetical protein
MLVFSYGMPKSGSTLAFQLAKGVALLGGHWQPMTSARLRWPGLPLHLANDLHVRLPKGPPQTMQDRRRSLALQVAIRRATWGQKRLAPLDPALGVSGHVVPFAEVLDPEVLHRLAALAGDRILLIKTHAAPSPEWSAAYCALAARGQVRAHVNHRDPRDTCLALVDAARILRARGVTEFTEYLDLEAAIEGVQRYLGEVALWCDLPNTLHLRYESCAFETDAAIDLIKADLGVDCDNGLVRHYATRLSHTQRNKARPDRYREELDAGQRARLTEMFGPYLRAWGYAMG